MFRHSVIPFFAVIGLLFNSEFVTAGHLHSAVVPYSMNANVLPQTPLDYSNLTALNSFVFAWDTLPAPPPPPADSYYEISDITEIDITLNFTGGTVTAGGNTINWGSIDADGPRGGPLFSPAGGYTFTTGVALKLTFPAHQMAGAIERFLPAYFSVGLFTPANHDFEILSASATISGSDYYRPLPIPEPSSLTLMMTALTICSGFIGWSRFQ